jgi:hypothetical protein
MAAHLPVDGLSGAAEQTPVAEIVQPDDCDACCDGYRKLSARNEGEKEKPMVGHRVRVFALAGALAAASMAAASSATAANFDGAWSVLVQTPDHCGTSQWRVAIIDGQVHHPDVVFVGGYPAGVAGRVSPSGRIAINVTAGPRFASGTGRLGQRQGSGTWAGRGPSGTCAGTWTATRVQPGAGFAASGDAAYAWAPAFRGSVPQMPMTYGTETYPPPSRLPYR